MTRRAEFIPYRPKTVLNKNKRADHWFWSRYSAYPYVGCQHGCLFCYCREKKYCPYDDPTDFSRVIKVKENAPALVRRGLSRAPLDVVSTGDYQPLERKFMVSRKILEVCYDLGFPVFILERSPLILRDLDLLQAIQQRACVLAAFSAIYTPGSPQADRMRKMENLAPPPKKRFAAMQKLAEAGICTGTSFMPILPGICDSLENIENVVRWTADHGGQFVLAGGLTLADQQRTFFLQRLDELFPEYTSHYLRLYPENRSYGSTGSDPWKTARMVRECCHKHGISDRVPRPIIPGDKRTLNKRVVELLANEAYHLEIDEAPGWQVWRYRKAAWAVEDLEQELGLFYRTLGFKGLESLPGIGVEMGKVVEKLIKDPI
jgi:DNA repair photolyase